MSEESEKDRKNPNNYNYVAVVSSSGEVLKLSAVHKDDDQTCLDNPPFLQTGAEIKTAETAAPIILDKITTGNKYGGSTRKTHNGGRKHKGKKSRGKGRKSRSKSKSRSKARR